MSRCIASGFEFAWVGIARHCWIRVWGEVLSIDGGGDGNYRERTPGGCLEDKQRRDV